MVEEKEVQNKMSGGSVALHIIDSRNSDSPSNPQDENSIQSKLIDKDDNNNDIDIMAKSQSEIFLKHDSGNEVSMC